MAIQLSLFEDLTKPKLINRPSWRILFEYETWERYYKNTLTYKEYNSEIEKSNNYVPISTDSVKPEVLKEQKKRWKYTED